MPAPKPKTTNNGGKPLWFIPSSKHVCAMLLHALIALPCLSQSIGNWAFTNTMVGTGGTYNTVSVANFSAGIPTKVFNASGEYYNRQLSSKKFVW
jgi:hypothetical protein